MITASILDYLGKYESGILVSVGLMYNENYYESIFYYTSDKMIINIDEKLHSVIGDIELTDHYVPLMKSIIEMVDPYEDIIDSLSDYNPTWGNLDV